MPLTIKAARVNAGFSRKEVAEKLDLSVTGYAKKENGKSKFYIDEVVVLSDLFKVDMLNFFEVKCLKKTQKEVPR
ncbi:helix-turn-helix transcriptional regulator [Paenibacillus lautus]|uniref:helix-turn-helix domain-containing protein n=1 Tax=Paenibacillus lautus TaxID=1401 RepID=UPI003D2BEF92